MRGPAPVFPDCPLQPCSSRPEDGRPTIRGAGLLDEAANIAALHVEQHRRQQEPVLGRNHRRSPCMLDARELTDWDSSPIGGGDEDLGQRLRVGPVAGAVSDPHRKAGAPLDRRRQHGFADGRLNDPLHGANADPERAAALRSTAMFTY